jgi:hypothetical protein
LPFIPLLKDRCEVHDMNSQTDYRLVTEFAGGANCVFFQPLDDVTERTVAALFKRLCKNEIVEFKTLTTQGRRVMVPQCGKKVRCAWFEFGDLCDKALGAGDYLIIAETFSTVFINNIPQLTLQERDQVRRFITCIDAFYEKKVKVVIRGACEAQNLFVFDSTDKATAVQDEIFAWDRTVSRMIEMQSEEYLINQAIDTPVHEYWEMFDLARITDEDCDRIWLRYAHGEDALKRDEFKHLVEDIVVVTGGPKAVPETVINSLIDTIDENHDGLIQLTEFRTFAKNFGVKEITTRVSDSLEDPLESHA